MSMSTTKIIIIAHNIRSAHNVGALLRTAEGLGIKKVYLSGYTPYPIKKNDERLPHIAKKTHSLIIKTSLGAESTQTWGQHNDSTVLINNLKSDGWYITGLEQTNLSTNLQSFLPPQKVVIVLGNEVSGIEQPILAQCDKILEIPMFGKKESFNVVEAGTMAMYHCRFFGHI